MTDAEYAAVLRRFYKTNDSYANGLGPAIERAIELLEWTPPSRDVLEAGVDDMLARGFSVFDTIWQTLNPLLGREDDN